MQPFAPAGVIVSDRAATVPELFFGPSAVTHSPVWSAAAWITVDVVTLTVVGTLMVVVIPVVPVSVTDVPVTDLTRPRAAVNPAAPAGGEKLGRGVAPGRGLKEPPPPPNPVVAQDPLTGALSRTVDAVNIPAASLVPVAVMQTPGVMFARVPVLVWVIVVVVAYVTVEFPGGAAEDERRPVDLDQLAEGCIASESGATTG